MDSIDDIPSREREIELDGCEKNHCHARRSLRQEDTLTDDGKVRACHRPAGAGTSHPGNGKCKLHMGSTKNNVKSVQRKVAEKAIVTLGAPLDIDPAQALLQEVQRTAGHVAWINNIITGLEAGDLVWGTVETVEDLDPEIAGDLRATKVTNRASLNMWYVLYEKERKHLSTVCKLALDAGVSERIVKVYEQVGDTFVAMMERVLDRIELTDAQRAAVPAAVVAELTAMTGDTKDGKEV